MRIEEGERGKTTQQRRKRKGGRWEAEREEGNRGRCDTRRSGESYSKQHDEYRC